MTMLTPAATCCWCCRRCCFCCACCLQLFAVRCLLFAVCCLLARWRAGGAGGGDSRAAPRQHGIALHIGCARSCLFLRLAARSLLRYPPISTTSLILYFQRAHTSGRRLFSQLPFCRVPLPSTPAQRVFDRARAAWTVLEQDCPNHRIVVQCAPCASNGPNHLGFCASSSGREGVPREQPPEVECEAVLPEGAALRARALRVRRCFGPGWSNHSQ